MITRKRFDDFTYFLDASIHALYRTTLSRMGQGLQSGFFARRSTNRDDQSNTLKTGSLFCFGSSSCNAIFQFQIGYPLTARGKKSVWIDAGTNCIGCQKRYSRRLYRNGMRFRYPCTRMGLVDHGYVLHTSGMVPEQEVVLLAASDPCWHSFRSRSRE